MSDTIIAFVTSNSGKLSTARDHLQSLDVTLEQVTLDLDEIQATSVEAVAMHKAQQAFRTLRRPLIIEDSGFFIDELNGFPGPFVKFAVQSLGAEGIARLADMTSTRHAHFEGVLVYIDSHGVPRTFTDTGDGGTVAAAPTEHQHPGAWSALWDIFIPDGATAPLSALPEDERIRIFEDWATSSVFAQFGSWLERKQKLEPLAALQSDARLRSSDLNFTFPAERIPARPRNDGTDRLLLLDRHTGQIEHHFFTNLPALLPPRSLIIINNSLVVRAALRRVPDDGTYLHIIDPFQSDLDDVTCLCPWKPKPDTSVQVNGGRYFVESSPQPGRDIREGRIVPDDPSIKTLQAFMERYGDVPIPIYVNAQREPDEADTIDYQNVYASVPGSVACATAGLHLQADLLDELRRADHEIAEVTLHIGYGTWKSLASEYVDEHRMDAEHCELPAATLDALRVAKQQHRPVVAVGTSSVRTLETFADEILGSGSVQSLRAATTLYIAPPFRFQVVDHMVTNFAYPQTPIMAMTAAFVGSTELLFSAYRTAVSHPDYLFFSYGDGMLLR